MHEWLSQNRFGLFNNLDELRYIWYIIQLVELGQHDAKGTTQLNDEVFHTMKKALSPFHDQVNCTIATFCSHHLLASMLVTCLSLFPH